MKNNKLVFWLKVIVGGMVVIAGLVNLIRGIATNEVWAILCSAALLILAAGLVWAIRSSRKPVDGRMTDPVYLELRSFLRETLLPVGFGEEQEGGGLVFTSTYTLGELSVRLGKDLREDQYFFGIANQSNNVEINGMITHAPDYDFIDAPGGEVEGFKDRVRKRLTDWLGARKIV